MVFINFNVDEFIGDDDYGRKLQTIKTKLIETKNGIDRLKSQFIDVIPPVLDKLFEMAPEQMTPITKHFAEQVDIIGYRSRKLNEAIVKLEEKSEVVKPEQLEEEMEFLDKLAIEFNDYFEMISEVKSKDSENTDIDDIVEEIYK